MRGTRARPIEYEVTETGCWVVTSHKPSPAGYVSATVDGRMQLLHRWSWERTAERPIPAGMMVRHTCDNPPCINPHHLLTGWEVQNAHDAMVKGRLCRGSRRRTAVLTEELVLDARKWRAVGADVTVLANHYGVPYSPLSAALKGVTWQHVPFVEGGKIVSYEREHFDVIVSERGCREMVEACSPFWRPAAEASAPQ